jgi:hypothetical protein
MNKIKVRHHPPAARKFDPNEEMDGFQLRAEAAVARVWRRGTPLLLWRKVVVVWQRTGR